MNKFEIVIQKLEQQNLSPEIKSEIINENSWSEIIWTADSNEVCFIYEDNIANEDNKIAWF